MKVVGASQPYERRIHGALQILPPYLRTAARINAVVVSADPETKQLVASFRHQDRNLYVYPDVGLLLQKALVHEVGHACDDNFGSPHAFSSSDDWLSIHRDQAYFDLPKYRDEPLEYFADVFAKWFLLGPQKMNINYQRETGFLTGVVFPALQAAFTGEQP